MIPAENEPSLRDRVMEAMDTVSVSVRVQNLIDLLETYGGEQARIAYRQGYQSAELNNRDQLERANSLIRKLAPEALAAEVETAEACDLLRDVLVDYVPEYTGDDETTDCQCSAHRARLFVRAHGVEL